MPDFEEIDQMVMLSRGLWFLPRPARQPIAKGLYELGFRVHPELATKQVVTDGVPGLANIAPQALVNIQSQREGEHIIRQFAPDLAEKMDAATTSAQKMALMAEIRSRYGHLIQQAEQQMQEQQP
jgi:hypothetical protein